VDWLRRGRREPSQDATEANEETPSRVERASPGVAALFESVGEGGDHAVLDFGPAVGGNLRVYSRFARRVRFADLLTAPPAGTSWEAALGDLPSFPNQRYDLVFAWNVLDRIAPEQRHLFVERLVDLTAPNTRLYVVVDTTGDRSTRPLRFNLIGEDRVSQEPTGPPIPAWPQILPAEMERLLEPFRVTQAFVLRLGMREYVAVRG
jgi:hypothetical protein